MVLSDGIFSPGFSFHTFEFLKLFCWLLTWKFFFIMLPYEGLGIRFICQILSLYETNVLEQRIYLHRFMRHHMESPSIEAATLNKNCGFSSEMLLPNLTIPHFQAHGTVRHDCTIRDLFWKVVGNQDTRCLPYRHRLRIQSLPLFQLLHSKRLMLNPFLFSSATSDGTKSTLKSTKHGHCKTHRMKMVLHVCLNEQGIVIICPKKPSDLLTKTEITRRTRHGGDLPSTGRHASDEP